MNNKEFVKAIELTFNNCLKIVESKNKDYATDSNPFKSFKSSEIAGVEIDKAILVRTLDKLSRIGTLLGKSEKAEVKDESINDTINDAINYLAILSSYLKHEKYKTIK